MLLTKFGKHPNKHEKEEAIIVRRKKERKKKRQDPSKLGVAA